MKIQDLTQECTIDSAGMLSTVGGARDGISALIQVTQLKSQSANDESLVGADSQQQPQTDPKKKATIGSYTLRTNAGAWATFGASYGYRR